MMFKKTILFALCIFAMLFTGCYDNNEIDTLATVMAVGVENTASDKFKLYTFAVSDAGGSNSDSSGDGASLICYVQKAANIKNAIEYVDRKISKKLSFSHMSALLFSIECASKDMFHDAKYFEKDVKVRPQLMLAVTSLSPQEYLKKLNPKLEANPEKYFQRVFHRSETYVPSLSLSDFFESFYCKKTIPVPIISGKSDSKEISEQDAYISSCGFVRQGRYVAELADKAVPGLLFSDKKVKIGNARVRSVKPPEITLDIKNENPVANVTIFAESDRKFSVKSLENRIESLLCDYAKKSYDLINISFVSRRYFTDFGRLQKPDDVIWKKTKFRVKVEATVKGEI